jgi:Protein of unknown function (DUF3987)
VGVKVNDLPSIVSRKNLRHYWWYKNESGKAIALVVRHDDTSSSKKYFHQYQSNEYNEWEEGMGTPSPLFGIETLNHSDFDVNVYIFEGEKCTQAAHQCGFTALTSMIGAEGVEKSDWAILARYRNFKQFVLIPDHDEPGRRYMRSVAKKIKQACPRASIKVCFLPYKNKGDDFIEWLQTQIACPKDWNGFSTLTDSVRSELSKTFHHYVKDNLISLDESLFKEDDINFEFEPEPIIEIFPDVLPCPIETFPTAINSWIKALGDQMQVPLDYLAVPFVNYAGSVIGRKVGLSMRANSKWIEYPNLWGMIIGRPSSMKSPPMKAVQAPLQRLAQRAKEKYHVKFATYQESIKFWKILEKEQSKIYQSMIQGSFEKSSNFGSSLPIPPPIIDPPKEPKCKRYKTQDATVEKIGELLRDNPQGILVYRDELSGWLNSLRKNGREDDRQFFIETWCSKEEWDVDRIGRGSIDIPPMCLSIFGSIQPGPISKYVSDTVKGGAKDDGLLQRFQLTVWPNPVSEWKLIPPIPLETLEENVFQKFEFLDALQFNEKNEPNIIHFSCDAQILFDSWQEKWEFKTRKGGLPEYLEAHLVKYKKLLAALAIIFELLHHQPLDFDCNSNVSKKSLESALLWIDYLESHAVRLYSCGLNAIPKAAKELLRKIEDKKLEQPFSARDVYNGNHWSGLTNSDQVNEVINYLLEKKHLISKQFQSGGRSTIKYYVHPNSYKNI